VNTVPSAEGNTAGQAQAGSVPQGKTVGSAAVADAVQRLGDTLLMLAEAHPELALDNRPDCGRRSSGGRAVLKICPGDRQRDSGTGGGRVRAATWATRPWPVRSVRPVCRNRRAGPARAAVRTAARTTPEHGGRAPDGPRPAGNEVEGHHPRGRADHRARENKERQR